MDLPPTAKTLTVRLTYGMVAGMNPGNNPEWVLRQLGWSLTVVGAQGSVARGRDLTELQVQGAAASGPGGVFVTCCSWTASCSDERYSPAGTPLFSSWPKAGAAAKATRSCSTSEPPM